MDIQDIYVSRSTTLRKALQAMDERGKRMLLLVSQEGVFERTVTDGDLRRELLAGTGLDDALSSLPEHNSVTATAQTTPKEALALFNNHSIDCIPILSSNRTVESLLHRSDLNDPILLSTPHMGAGEKGFIDQAFKTNWIAPLGPNVDAFEQELSDLTGVATGAAVNSGTAAIHLAMRLLDVRQGDRVFCSSLTFAASCNPIVYQGATPVFIDSEYASWNMCPRALENAFESARREGWRPKAVVVVNLYGQSADFDAIKPICDAYDTPIIEDAAESLGARYKGRPSGSFGLLSVFSFNGNKIITTSGGGMLLSDDESLIERARFLATQARDPAPHYQHSEIGFNYRMSNILAGVGRGQLGVLSERVEARRKVFETYQTTLGDLEEIEWMPEPEWSYSTHWLSVCTIKKSSQVSSDHVRKHLANDLIEARPVWKPMHLQPVFENSSYFTAEEHSISDKLFTRGICLPSGSNLSEEQIEMTVASIRNCFGAG